MALGQILVCGTVLRSGLMLRCSEDEQKEVVDMLLAASKKKSYLNTVAYLILLDFVNRVGVVIYKKYFYCMLPFDIHT